MSELLFHESTEVWQNWLLRSEETIFLILRRLSHFLPLLVVVPQEEPVEPVVEERVVKVAWRAHVLRVVGLYYMCTTIKYIYYMCRCISCCWIRKFLFCSFLVLVQICLILQYCSCKKLYVFLYIHTVWYNFFFV